MGVTAAIGSALGGVASSVIGASSASDAANAQVQAANAAQQTQLQMYNQTRQDLLPFQNTGTAANAQLAYLYGIGPNPYGGAGGGYTPQAGGYPSGAGTGAMPYGYGGAGYGGGYMPQGMGYGPGGTGPYGGHGLGANFNPGTAAPGYGPGYGPHPPVGAGGPTGVPNYQAMFTALENTPGYQFTQQQGVQALDRSAGAQGLLLSGGQQKAVEGYGQGLAQTNAWAPYIAQLNALSTAGQNSAAKTGELGQGYAGNIGSAQLAAGTAQANGALLGGQSLSNGIAGVGNSLSSLYGSSYGPSALSSAFGYNQAAYYNPTLSGVPAVTPGLEGY